VRISYVSKGGTVEMGGGRHSFMNISMMNGFGIPAREYETIHYASQDGQTTTGSYDLPRTITLTGDFYGGQHEIMQVLKAFYYPGELYCDFGIYKRKISCKCINMEDIERNANCGINGFTIQFQADNPYFCDYYDTVVSLASYKNHITDTFTLPCVFSEIIAKGSAYVKGDKDCAPTITLTTPYEPTVEDSIITLENLTTGAKLSFAHVIKANENITVNIAKRRLTSDIDGDITNSITDDTDLSKFYLVPGDNEISFYHTETARPLTAIMSYNNLYLMAERE
jgi:hypothetical protein